ncbi:transposase-like protein [Polaromonas sp. CG_23.6]|nr:transposase-like protein [Polaromonas sp. CG_23.6]
MRFPIDVILVCLHGHEAYLLTCRHFEKMMQEHSLMLRALLD